MKKLPVAVQVYSVRDEAEADFAGTMRQLKDMGYDGVELAGLYSYSKEEIKEILSDVGLPAISAHVPFAEMREDIGKVIDTYKYLGCRYVVVPYLMEGQRPGDDAYEAVRADIARFGDAFAAAGLQLLYHNHDFEFKVMPNGQFALDELYAGTTPTQLQAEPDTCWIKVAGQDPAAYVLKYTGRVPIVHLKDFHLEGSGGKLYDLIGIESQETEASGSFEFRPLGLGQQDIPSILDASLKAGAAWVVVEQDESVGRSRMEAVEISRKYLKSLGW
ncbi:MAG: sugar phosphate isomerase/epimerase family protein [Saccharofermentanales bacterium]|jgi:sugar phosphate isomerase/epimerase